MKAWRTHQGKVGTPVRPLVANGGTQREGETREENLIRYGEEGMERAEHEWVDEDEWRREAGNKSNYEEEEEEEEEKRRIKKEGKKQGVKIRKAPVGPTRKEREEHEATHAEFKDWCKHCVRGRGRNNPHRRKAEGGEEDKEEQEVPRIAIDYHFMKDKNGEDQVPLITMVDSKTKAVWQRVVDEKGAAENQDG